VNAVPYIRGAALAFVLMVASVQRDAAAEDEVARGTYLVRAAGCAGCHTDSKGKGAPFAGGRELKTPFGVYYSPNITPDPETGIGRWSDRDFLNALQQGLRPDGTHYFPVFPYTTYTKMRDEDAVAIKAYLFSLAPVRRENRAHDVWPPFDWRWTIGPWKSLYFEAGRWQPEPNRSEAWNRGAYLVEALAHCGECHTPRNAAGGLRRELWMAGSEDGPEGEIAANITPDPETGIGDWSRDDIVALLREGTKPDFDIVQGLMEEAIEEGLGRLSQADLEAIAVYVRALPPIRHQLPR